jgi:hypothetical protein
LRITVEGIHKNDLSVELTNVSKVISWDKLELYDFIIVPDSIGYIYISVRSLRQDIDFNEFTDSFYVYRQTNTGSFTSHQANDTLFD